MDAGHINAVSKFFAWRRLSRRQALARTGAGLAAAGLTAVTAQEATPAAPDAEHGPEMLFVQSFQSGSIAPKEGTDGRYVVTLEHGLGQTIYFSDRPDRIVGAGPTEAFLRGLGFPPENPPNAALVVETAPGVSDIAVVELFDPVYDPAGPTVTYEMAVLADRETSSGLGITAAPTDLATLAPSFGPAHLFIDGCPTDNIECYTPDFRFIGAIANHDFGGFCYSYEDYICVPCTPWYSEPADIVAYWSMRCNDRFSECNGECEAHNAYRIAD